MFRTKYLGPTDHRPARIKVTDVHFRRSIYVAWNDEWDVEFNHDAAWREMLRRFDVSPRKWGRISTSEGFLYVAKDAIRDVDPPLPPSAFLDREVLRTYRERT